MKRNIIYISICIVILTIIALLIYYFYFQGTTPVILTIIALVIYFFFFHGTTLPVTKITLPFSHIDNNKNDDDIDVVITWVDSSDENWRHQKTYYKTLLNHGGSDHDTREIRFPPIDFVDTELALCVKLIMKFMKFVRHIYIVVARPHYRDWFKTIDKLKVVYHDEIWPDKIGLPTFNSTAIESCLHRIPGLAEKFIYFNDDTYVVAPLQPHDFFHPISGTPIQAGQIENRFIYSLLRSNTYHAQWLNVYNRLRHVNIIIPLHVATSLTKTLMQQTEEIYGDMFVRTRHSRFRNKSSIPPIGAAMNINCTIWADSEKYKFVYLDNNIQHNLKRILESKNTCQQLCINNVTSRDICFIHDSITVALLDS